MVMLSVWLDVLERCNNKPFISPLQTNNETLEDVNKIPFQSFLMPTRVT